MVRGEVGSAEVALSGAEVIAPTFAVSYDRGEQIIAKLQPSRDCPPSGTLLPHLYIPHLTSNCVSESYWNSVSPPIAD